MGKNKKELKKKYNEKVELSEKIYDVISKSSKMEDLKIIKKEMESLVLHFDTETYIRENVEKSQNEEKTFKQHMIDRHTIINEAYQKREEIFDTIKSEMVVLDKKLIKLKEEFVDVVNSVVKDKVRSYVIVNDLFKFKHQDFAKTISLDLIKFTKDTYLRCNPPIMNGNFNKHYVYHSI